jgi:hypothetical protein
MKEGIFGKRKRRRLKAVVEVRQERRGNKKTVEEQL